MDRNISDVLRMVVQQVAPREGGVDRNCRGSPSAGSAAVAPREGGVDRNLAGRTETTVKAVAPREGGVDRNIKKANLFIPIKEVAPREGGVDRNDDYVLDAPNLRGRPPREVVLVARPEAAVACTGSRDPRSVCQNHLIPERCIRALRWSLTDSRGGPGFPEHASPPDSGARALAVATRRTTRIESRWTVAQPRLARPRATEGPGR